MIVDIEREDRTTYTWVVDNLAQPVRLVDGQTITVEELEVGDCIESHLSLEEGTVGHRVVHIDRREWE